MVIDFEKFLDDTLGNKNQNKKDILEIAQDEVDTSKKPNISSIKIFLIVL